MMVFVYGTLKKGYGNHRLLEQSKFIGTGNIKGFEIYDLGSYPGIVPGEISSEVYGEVYDVDQETLTRLDRLESNGFLYLRELIEVTLEKEILSASIYVYNRRLDGAQRLSKEWRKLA